MLVNWVGTFSTTMQANEIFLAVVDGLLPLYFFPIIFPPIYLIIEGLFASSMRY